MNDTVTAYGPSGQPPIPLHEQLARHREALRSHRPTVEITLDLGELGELPATVEYEGIPAEPGDYYQPSRPAYLIISSVMVRDFGEMLPGIERQHRDVLEGIKDKVGAVLGRYCGAEEE